METVLVTGGSGFVGSWCVLRLLQQGYNVRTTIREAGKEEGVRALLNPTLGEEPIKRLAFAVADLQKDDGWALAVKDCQYVLHVASPFPAKQPDDEQELIVPARDGTLRVLRAARDAGVKRVVLTSSFAAVGYGPPKPIFTEEDWTPADAPNPPYIRSKAIAERAAWDFMQREGGDLELTSIIPPGIFGPALGSNYSASHGVIKGLLDGQMPGMPDIYFAVVDVRDLVDLHLAAMTSPAAKGQRFIATSGEPLALHEVWLQFFGLTSARQPLESLRNDFLAGRSG